VFLNALSHLRRVCVLQDCGSSGNSSVRATQCADRISPAFSQSQSYNFLQACASDILLVASYLSDATDAITLAVEDCGGTNDQCTKDIADIAEYLGNATSEISKAVTACAGPKTKVECEADIAEGSIDVAKAVKAIVAAAKDCGANSTAY
jgi:hypothetical protein